MRKLIKIELIKIKNTSILSFVFFATVVPIIMACYTLDSFMKLDDKTDVWKCLMDFGGSVYYQFLLPIIIMIVSIMHGRIEHINNGWRLMLSQSKRRTDIYRAKFIVLFLISSSSILIFHIAIDVISFLYGVRHFSVGMLLMPFLQIVVTLSFLSFQFLIATFIHSTQVALAIGVCTIIPISIVSSSSKYCVFYPWSYPANILIYGVNGIKVWFMIIISIFITYLLFVCGNQAFQKVELK